MLQQRALQEQANGGNQQAANYMGSQMRPNAQLHNDVAGGEVNDQINGREMIDVFGNKVIKPVVAQTSNLAHIAQQLKPNVAKKNTDTTIVPLIPKNMKTANIKEVLPAKLQADGSSVYIHQSETPMDSCIGPSELMCRVRETADLRRARALPGGPRSKTPNQLPDTMPGAPGG